MQDLKTVLTEAAGEGLIATEQVGPLAQFLAGRGISIGGNGVLPGDLPRPDLAEASAFESEAPRFVRGFHDVLITIGIIIALVGVWGLGSFFAALPAIIVLAEILVRRQRLALPAVVLTIAFAQWILAIAYLMVTGLEDTTRPSLIAMAMAAPFPLLLAPFYWRYRVPLSLAMLLMSAASVVLVIVFYLLELLLGSQSLIISHTFLSSLIFLLAALGVFSLAMRFELKDPYRQSRDSDIAFWLHLGTAPILLYAMLSFIFLQNLQDFTPFSSEGGTWQALAVVLVVAIFMVVGLVIDRRAFITSGLLSLGFSIFQLFQKSELKADIYYWVTMLLVGFVVLGIGIGWPYFRRTVVRQLPMPLQTKLPPLR